MLILMTFVSATTLSLEVLLESKTPNCRTKTAWAKLGALPLLGSGENFHSSAPNFISRLWSKDADVGMATCALRFPPPIPQV